MLAYINSLPSNKTTSILGLISIPTKHTQHTSTTLTYIIRVHKFLFQFLIRSSTNKSANLKQTKKAMKSIFWLTLVFCMALASAMSYKKNDQDIYEAGDYIIFKPNYYCLQVRNKTMLMTLI